MLNANLPDNLDAPLTRARGFRIARCVSLVESLDCAAEIDEFRHVLIVR